MPSDTFSLALDETQRSALYIALGRGRHPARLRRKSGVRTRFGDRPPRRGLTVPPNGHPRRPGDVGGSDKLRAGRLGHRSTGYRYDLVDPATGRPWPEMPQAFADLASEAAAAAGFEGFHPTLVWSIATRRAHVCRFTRTATNATSISRSCRCRWACRRSSYGAARRAPIGSGAFRCCTAMSRSGADRIV